VRARAAPTVVAYHSEPQLNYSPIPRRVPGTGDSGHSRQAVAGRQALLAAAGFVLLLAPIVGPNAGLVAAASASLAMSAILWRPGEPAILLLIYLYHWLQASVGTLQATLSGIPFEQFTQIPGRQIEAVLLTQTALIVWALGLRLGAGPQNPSIRESFSTVSARRPLSAWFRIYLFVSAIGWTAQYLGAAVPGLSQIIGGIAALRWAFYFLFVAVAFSRGMQTHPLVIIAFVLEFFMTFGGYFSEFKTVFFVTFLAAVLGRLRLSLSGAVALSALAATALFLGVVWTAVKGEYRGYVSGGVQAQVVNVSFEGRMAKLGEMIRDLKAEDLSAGFDQMLRRISYTEFFGATLTYVPDQLPHEGGALSADALTRPFTPRILFPTKSIIDDSIRTTKYTGIVVASSTEGASISLGWVAEFYIDFGKYGMMMAALLFGGILGYIKRYFENWSYSRGIVGGAVAMSILLIATYLESSITKVAGGLVASVLAAWLVLRFIVPRWLAWLRTA
jgi:hypothetical protein